MAANPIGSESHLRTYTPSSVKDQGPATLLERVKVHSPAVHVLLERRQSPAVPVGDKTIPGSGAEQSLGTNRGVEAVDGKGVHPPAATPLVQ